MDVIFKLARIRCAPGPGPHNAGGSAPSIIDVVDGALAVCSSTIFHEGKLYVCGMLCIYPDKEPLVRFEDGIMSPLSSIESPMLLFPEPPSWSFWRDALR